jgi:aryl-alcohol dehydrogenase-like predicted oxidoreductase
MNFGAITSEADAQVIMDAAHEHGINFFGSSNTTYGQPRAEGVTESVIGRWMAAGRGRRDRTVPATKLYGGKAGTNQLIANPSLGPVVCKELARTLGPVG